ncbi:helix-turn-helix domain-containing protein [Candidatus Poriferisocius sp.]|uniref:helix-turn-helix domain-containing protein n=1 Tax=Candidatus Poriferisocius sp. TaxID=3101276 RepID=UPI003B0279D6
MSDFQSDSQILWLNTETAAKRLGITTRTLYRFINEGSLPAYRMGRVIRVNQADVDEFIKLCRIEPGTLSHLYPDPVSSDDAGKGEGGDADAGS